MKADTNTGGGGNYHKAERCKSDTNINLKTSVNAVVPKL